MFTNHRWKRAKARHTAPKEQQGQEARILGKAWRSGLQSEQKAFSEAHRICHCTRFIRWIVEQVKEHKWSLDACVGYARLHRLFSAEEMVCTHTLYNEVWAGSLDLSVTELPEAI